MSIPISVRIRGLRLALCCIAFSLLGPAGDLHGIDVEEVRALLSRQIIPSSLPMEQVQAYTEARVPPVPALASAEAWTAEAERLRGELLEQVILRGEAARWDQADCRVEWLESIEGLPGYRIRKLRYEALPGMWIPALLYEPVPAGSGQVPVVLNVNGHDGKGKAAAYKQIRCINQAKRGMIALNLEWLGMGQLSGPGFLHYRMNQLDLCGTSGLAPFYLALKRGLDLLLAHERADPERVAVAGLSGGGWQTIFISALDTRVTLANPVAGYSSFRTRARFLSDLGDSEQTPSDFASVADYTHLTAMLAPRPALLTYNARDNCCFASAHALPPLLEAALPVYALLGKRENLYWHVNHEPGDHNFEANNREALYRIIGEYFFASSGTHDPAEIPSAAEVKSAEELAVELPSPNHDFHSLAVELSRALPRAPPAGSEAVAASRERRRARLAELVRAKTYTVAAENTGSATQAGLAATFWRLDLGGAWTLPAVELSGAAANGTVLLVADGGRTEAAPQAARLLAGGRRVIAVDPFYFGESRLEKLDFLFALLVAAVGDRPLGIQASQLAAVARWAKARHPSETVELAAVGPRSSLFALLAVALEEEAASGLELHGGLTSLKEVIESDWTVKERPELFCFGLLEELDIPHLLELAAPRPVRRGP
jgi:hypothetical protein